MSHFGAIAGGKVHAHTNTSWLEQMLFLTGNHAPQFINYNKKNVLIF